MIIGYIFLPKMQPLLVVGNVSLRDSKPVQKASIPNKPIY